MLLLMEAEAQCRFALIGADLLEKAEQMPMQPGVRRPDYFWFAVQSILIAAGNLKNTLFTSKGGSGPDADASRAAQLGEREPMRQSIQLDDSSCLAKADLRNSLEHFDDRITRWHRTTKTGNLSVRHISNGDSVNFPQDTQPFGRYNRDTGDVTFWAQGRNKTANVHQILDECRRLLPLIEQEISRLLEQEQRERFERWKAQHELP